MKTSDEFFEEYIALRLQGQTENEAQGNLIYGIQSLSISAQISLKQRFQAWEDERSLADFDIEERTKLSRITLEITLCPSCESPNMSGVKKCQICGANLVVEDSTELEIVAIDGSVKAIDESVLITLSSTSGQICLRPQLSEKGLRLGRSSSDTQIEVDLTGMGAEDLGVSRLHVLLEYDKTNREIYATDLGSRNGTFINGFRLPVQMRSRLRDGDELRLGRLKLRLGFQDAHNQAQD